MSFDTILYFCFLCALWAIPLGVLALIVWANRPRKDPDHE